MTTNEELKKLAEAATPGPWRTGSISRWCSLPHQHGGNACKYTNVSWNDDPAFFGRYVSVASDGAEIVGGDDYGPKLSLSDAVYIAAANPARVLALLHDLATVTRERDEALADRDKWRSLEREASHYCEIPIALRTNFTGDPPYVGWEGLGLAMTQAFDERDEFLERERKAVAAAAVLGEVRARHQEDERDADRTREQMFDAAIQCFNDRAALLATIDALSRIGR